MTYRDVDLQSNTTARLAQAITRASSKQTYYTARLLVDKLLVHDFYRAYAYFRWADDIIDASALPHEERLAFIKRQHNLIDTLYDQQQPDDLSPEEEIVATLIRHDRHAQHVQREQRGQREQSEQGEQGGLQSFIRNMLAVIEFDAEREGQLISQDALTGYSAHLAKSVTDGIQYFIGNGHPYPITDFRYHAATAAHITHLLRDMVQDIADGFINIPREYLNAHGIGPLDVDSPPFRAWVRERVTLARQYFDEGKQYLDQLAVLRCKMAGYWYCARFESVLDAIEADGYILQPSYRRRRRSHIWFNVFWLGSTLPLRHLLRSKASPSA